MNNERLPMDLAANKRVSDRRDVHVWVHFRLHGESKIFDARTRNISLAGVFMESFPELLQQMFVGQSVILLLEYKKYFLMRLCGYIVRLEQGNGFAVKFLNLTEEQMVIIRQLGSAEDTY